MSGLWPGDTRCVVILTFDVDGPTATLNRNPELADQPSVISMGEFGPRVAVPRILDLLDGHDVRAEHRDPPNASQPGILQRDR